MSDSTTPDEKPKKEVARRVVTPKRKYFFPESGRVVEAADIETATAEHNNTKEGDQE